MKTLKKVFIGIGIVLVVLIVVVALFLGPIIKTGVETAGPKIAGVDITLEKAGINLLSGNVKLKGLVIGNPEGFKTPTAMELGQFVVDLKMGSLFTDTIVIKRIHIDGPQITYEQGLKGNNLGRLQKNLASGEEKPKEEKPEEPKEKPDKAAKKVVVDDFLFENGKIHVSMTIAGGKKLTVPLAPIHLENIGKDEGGASLAEITSEVLNAIIQSAGDAVAASGDLASDALKGTGELVKDPGKTVDAAKDAGSAIKKGLGGLLKK